MNGNFFDDEEEIGVRPRRRTGGQGSSQDSARRARSGQPVRVKSSETALRRSEAVQRGASGGANPTRRKPMMDVREVRDPDGFYLDVDYIKYIAFAVVVIAVIVCSVRFLELSLIIVLIIQLLLILMGVLLRNTPVFVSTILAALILIAGMLTGNTDIVLCGSATYLATILTLRS